MVFKIMDVALRIPCWKSCEQESINQKTVTELLLNIVLDKQNNIL